MRLPCAYHAALLAALLMIVVCSAAAAGPRLEADGPHRDLGTVREGIQATVTFIIINTGDEEATIERVESPAACTSTDLSGRTAVPGEDVAMELLRAYRPGPFESHAGWKLARGGRRPGSVC